ncbi:MAG: hypothetical protein ACKV2T_43415 [Kofleriaceae bacterium]
MIGVSFVASAIAIVSEIAVDNPPLPSVASVRAALETAHSTRKETRSACFDVRFTVTSDRQSGAEAGAALIEISRDKRRWSLARQLRSNTSPTDVNWVRLCEAFDGEATTTIDFAPSGYGRARSQKVGGYQPVLPPPIAPLEFGWSVGGRGLVELLWAHADDSIQLAWSDPARQLLGLTARSERVELTAVLDWESDAFPILIHRTESDVTGETRVDQEVNVERLQSIEDVRFAAAGSERWQVTSKIDGRETVSDLVVTRFTSSLVEIPECWRGHSFSERPNVPRFDPVIDDWDVEQPLLVASARTVPRIDAAGRVASPVMSRSWWIASLAALLVGGCVAAWRVVVDRRMLTRSLVRNASARTGGQGSTSYEESEKCGTGEKVARGRDG